VLIRLKCNQSKRIIYFASSPYSPNGAKQRGAFLMRQPEIRVRVEQLRTGRHATHQSLLDDAAVQVKAIIADALEKKSCGLALRAIEFRLKLHGVIQDKRIAHHYHLDPCHPDADLEDLDPDAEEEFDAFLLTQPGKATAPKTPELPAPVVTPSSDLPKTTEPQTARPQTTKIVTRNSDRPQFLPGAPARTLALPPLAAARGQGRGSPTLPAFVQAASLTSPGFAVCRSAPSAARTAAGDMLSAR
jgi:hypothetical protein